MLESTQADDFASSKQEQETAVPILYWSPIRFIFMPTFKYHSIAACFLSLLCVDTVNAQQPNIVYILADDMGLGDVRSYTNAISQAGVDSPVDTPNIDRLANAGMRFTNAHSPSAVCTPTRYSLLTGQYTWRLEGTPYEISQNSGVLLNPYDKSIIAPNRVTVPEMLKAQGYDTAAFGKWHLGNNWTNNNSWIADDGIADFTQGATDHGFDYYYGDDVINISPNVWVVNDQVVSNALHTGQPYTQERSLPEMTRGAVAYLREHGSSGTDDDPFFMYMPLSAPHAPIVPPASVPADSLIGSTYNFDSTLDNYDNFIRLVDWSVGELIDTLEAQGLADNTMIVFTADNGVSTNFSGHDEISPGFVDGQLLRGRKADAWEGGHRVPLLVRWDGNVTPGSTSDSLVELTDFYATTAEMLGVNMPANAGEDSISYLDALEGDANAEGRSYGIQTSQWGSHAIRQIDDAGNELKLIFGVGGGGFLSGGSPTDIDVIIDESYNFNDLQMYNLTTDPGEQTNLFADGVSASELAKAQELQNLLLYFVSSGQSTAIQVLGDLNLDGQVDANDWQSFKLGFNQDLSSLSMSEAYAMGDLNGDLTNDHQDFIIFVSSYESANGPGAFQALANQIPEPTSAILALTGVASLLIERNFQSKRLPKLRD